VEDEDRYSGFRETGADNLAIQALALLDHGDQLWFHLDVDVLDPTLFLSNSVPASIGRGRVRHTSIFHRAIDTTFRDG
jgi:arginase family enzyme